MSKTFQLTNGQDAYYENGRLCLAPFRSPRIRSGSNTYMAKLSHKRARTSLSSQSDSKPSPKRPRMSEGASSMAAAQQSEAGDPEAGQSPEMEFYDANETQN